MASAQDQAFAELIAARGLLGADALAAAGASGEPLPQAVATRGLLPASTVSALLRELTRSQFGCRKCGMRFSYDSLARLASLRCPGCGGAIGLSEAPASSGSLPAVSPVAHRLNALPPSGSSFAALGPTGTIRSSGTGTVNVTHDAPPAPPPSAPGDSPTTLGPYTLITQLGRGSYGAVFLAKKQGLERRFALKILLDAEFADEETIARFELEAKVASKIDDPGILGVYDVGRDGDHLYYVMEFCPGENLKQHLREGRFEPRKAAKLVRRVAKTLAATHANGVIHRDIKPSNIILDEASGRPRVTDFGLARDHSLLRSMTQSGDILGTPHYMSPEQFRGERDLDHRIDIYALGVIFYECLTGERPFAGATPVELSQSVCNGEVRHPSSIAPDVPNELAAICLKAMSVRPDDRYPTAEALVEDLDRYLQGAAPLAAKPSKGLKVLLAAVGLMVIAAASLGIGVLIKRSPAGGVAKNPIEAGRLLTTAEAALKSDGPTPAIRADLERALELSAPGSRLHVRLKRTLETFRGWELLERVRNESPKRGPYEPLALELDQALTLSKKKSHLRVEILLEAARLSTRRGRATKALEAVALVPAGSGEGSLEARRLEGLALELKGQIGPALTLYRKLVDLDPQGAYGHCAAAALARRHSGESKAAAAAARLALKVKPRWVPALVELGHALLESDDPDDLDEAEAALSLATELAADDPRVQVGLGHLRLKENKPTSARRSLRAALDLYDEAPTPEAVVLYGISLLKLEKPAEAKKAFDELLARDGDTLEALVHRGALHYAEGNQDGAEADWKRAYALNAMQSQELLARWHPEEIGKAFHTISAGSARREKDPEFFTLGRVREEVVRHHHAQRLEAAGIPKLVCDDLIAAFVAAAKGAAWGDDMTAPLRRGLRFLPKSALAHTERLRLLAARDQTQAGFEALDMIRTLEVNEALDDELRLLSAELHWRAGHLGKALNEFNALATKSALSVSGLCARAQAAWLRGDYALALEGADTVLSKDSYNVTALTLKAMVQIVRGKPREALETVRDGYARVGALDSRLLAVRTALILEFQGATRGSTLFDLAEMFSERSSVDEHLAVCPGYFDDRLAAQLALDSTSNGPSRWARTGLPNLDASEPNSAHTLLLLGYSAARSDEAKKAAEHWRRARTLDESLPIPRPYIERYLEAGGESEAAASFRQRKQD